MLTLFLDPYAWAKLNFIYNTIPIEVSLYGITEKEPFTIKDFWIPYQFGTACTTEFDENKKCEEVDKLIEKGLDPNSFLKIWVHTHPKMNPTPSGVDVDTFKTKFQNLNYSIRLIFGQNQQMTAKYQQILPVAFDFDLKTEIDWTDFKSFGLHEKEELVLELKEKVKRKEFPIVKYPAYEGYPGYQNTFDHLLIDKYKRQDPSFFQEDEDILYQNKGISITDVVSLEEENELYRNEIEDDPHPFYKNYVNFHSRSKGIIPFKGMKGKKK